MKRGPKRKTRKNSPSKPADVLAINDLVPTVDLSPEALDEFLRLARVLEAQDRLEHVDVGVMTLTAQDKALMDRMNALIDQEKGFPDEKHITARNGVRAKWYTGMRALGLTTLPSRTHVHTKAKDSAAADPIASLIKLA
jgi:phage terminase small subunit